MFSHRLTDRAELRLFEERHADELFVVIDRNRAPLRRWMPWLDRSRSTADALMFIRETLQRFARDDGFDAGLWLDGRIVGAVGYHYWDHANRKTEIGYWLDEAAQGQGLMTRAAAALTDHALREMKLNRVEIRCAAGNERSRAIPLRLGFVEEGTLRQAGWLYDRYVDFVVYAMLAPDWKR